MQVGFRGSISRNDGYRKIERGKLIRVFFEAISGPAVGLRLHLCDELAAFFFLQSYSCDWSNMP